MMNDQKPNADVASRRHLLKLGAMAAPAVITLAPASARAAASVLNCRVPFPDNVDSNGNACATPTPAGGSGGNGSGRPPWAGGPGGNPNPGGGQGGQGGSGGNQNQPICYPGPGTDMPAADADALQKAILLQDDGGSSFDGQMAAYQKYLARVKSQQLEGSSCLMSIELAGR